VLAAIISRKQPGVDGFLERHPRSLFALECDEITAAAPPTCPSSFVNLARQCCDGDPENRPSATEICAWLEDLLTEVGDAEVDDVDEDMLGDLPERPKPAHERKFSVPLVPSVIASGL
jgi:hypothetical protein